MPSTFESGDFDEWLEHFEICAMANGWTVEQKSLKLATRLQVEALFAYKDIPMDDRKNYEIVGSPSKSPNTRRRKVYRYGYIHKRSLFPSESVQIYVYELGKLINRALPDGSRTLPPGHSPPGHCPPVNECTSPRTFPPR